VSTGQPSVDDETRERFARLARTRVGAPVSLVSLTSDPDGPLLAGADLPPGWASTTAPFLGDSFRRIVGARGTPVVVRDVTDDPTVRRRLDGPDQHVVAFAGFPVHDARSEPAGVLCVLDDQPHDWTETDLEVLEDLAALCSADLRRRAEHARAREIQRVMTQSNRQARLLLLLSDAFADAVTIADVAQIAGRVATTGLGARYTGLALLSEDGTSLRYTTMDGFPGDIEGWWQDCLVDDPHRPLAHVARTRTHLLFRDVDEMRARFPFTSPSVSRIRGARALMPLISSGELLGVLTLVWDLPRDFDDQSATIKAALGGYTAQALDRARLLAERQSVARTLQASMLSPLPTVEGVQITSIYEPAARTEDVGGDWYDAIELENGSLALMIGDVTGHDLAAAALMGQLRSMLRSFAWEHDEPPSYILALLDRANSGVRLEATGTAITACLDPADEPGGSRRFTWSSAGHPPPVVLRADGTVELLRARNDLMLGVYPTVARTDHETVLHQGDTLVLYTDGLVERRGEMLLDGIERLCRVLGSLAPLPFVDLPHALVQGLVADAVTDDTAVLVVRVG